MWSVGRQFTGGAYQNLVLHNGGHGWSVVPAPDPGPGSDNQLTAVSASGPSDAWASGFYATGNPAIPFDPQALHWDGTSWTAEPLPTLPGEFDSDTSASIVDISPADAWLVGAYLNSSGADVSIIAHWDGTAWSLVSHPAAAIALTAIAASGPGDVWAVGVGASPSFPAVIEHYNGSKWTVSATLPGIRLNGVTSIGPARAWAVGAGAGGNTTATVEWNGSSWNVVPSPNPSTDDGLSAISAVGGGDIWAVGNEVDFSTGVGDAQPMALHWDGTAWTTVPAVGVGPDRGGVTGIFSGVVAVTAARVVAVGWAVGQSQSLVADLCPFAVRDTGFTPSPARLSGPGAAAYWVIPKSDAASHELADGSGFGLFDSGIKAPGSSYAFAFPASGTWVVNDSSDGASEKVGVPMLVVDDVSGLPVGLQWADSPRPAGARFDVQDIPPGGTAFTRFRDTTRTGDFRLDKQLPPGTYEFRSRMRNPATDAATGWSPTVTVTVPAPSGTR
jgi:hypothetical protein